jgi:putative endonuclease
MYFVYILQSSINNSFYKGSTSNLQQRVNEHNSGKELSTARYLPWNLVWCCTKETRGEAVFLERKLKNLSIERTITFIQKHSAASSIGGPDVAQVRKSGC